MMFDMIEGALATRTATDPTSPLVVSVPHAGLGTAGFERTMNPELDVRCDADLFVDRLYRVGEPDGPDVYVAAQTSRFVCDMNRDPDDVSVGAVPEHPAPRNTDGRGFIWAITTTGVPTLSRPLALDEWRERTAIHAAYHDAVTRALARARERCAYAILVDGHSMPSRGRAGHKDPGRARADVVPGDRDGTSCAPALSALVSAHFPSRGYSVAANDPYKGGFITAHHGRPAEGVHAIQVELRRDLYMNEDAFTVTQPAFDQLRDAIDALVASLRAFKP